jgi:hypothetical protein
MVKCGGGCEPVLASPRRVTSHQHCVEVRARRWCSPNTCVGKEGAQSKSLVTCSGRSLCRLSVRTATTRDDPDVHLVQKRLLFGSKRLPKEPNLTAQRFDRLCETTHLVVRRVGRRRRERRRWRRRRGREDFVTYFLKRGRKKQGEEGGRPTPKPTANCTHNATDC